MINCFSSRPPFYYQNSQGCFPGDGAIFKVLTGAEWIDEMKVSSDLGDYDIHPALSEWELMRFLRPIYRQKRPELCLWEGETLGRHVLRALNDIPRGTLVTEYLGEWAPYGSMPSSYRFGPIDGLRYRNCGAMVEDGFPNLGAFYLYHVNGLPLRVIFVALEDIRASEILTVNYGMKHSVKIQYHQEYHLERMKAFFLHHSIESLGKNVRQNLSKKRSELGWSKSLELDSCVAKLQYLFHTPSSLLMMLLEGVLSKDSVFDFYDRLDNRLYLLGFAAYSTPRQQEIIECLQGIRSYFSKSRDQDDRLQDLLQKVRVRVVFKIFLAGLNEDGSGERWYHEALVVNRCMDAISTGDKELFSVSLASSTRRDWAVQECWKYAKELRLQMSEWPEFPDPPLVTAA